MEISATQSIIESILFAAGEPVSVNDLCDALDVDSFRIEQNIEQISEKYERGGHGIKIVKIDGGYQMCSVEANFDYVKKVVQPIRNQRLSPSALEVLAVVAYNQPITKTEIDNIRGSDSGYLIGRLCERELIEEADRLDAPGRPILYATTQEFLRTFGLSAITDLPELSESLAE